MNNQNFVNICRTITHISLLSENNPYHNYINVNDIMQFQKIFENNPTDVGVSKITYWKYSAVSLRWAIFNLNVLSPTYFDDEDLILEINIEDQKPFTCKKFTFSYLFGDMEVLQNALNDYYQHLVKLDHEKMETTDSKTDKKNPLEETQSIYDECYTAFRTNQVACKFSRTFKRMHRILNDVEDTFRQNDYEDSIIALNSLNEYCEHMITKIKDIKNNE